MAYQKLQASRALAVIPSDTINIPNVSATAASGTTTSTGANRLIDSSATFLDDNIKKGDIVYDTTNNVVTTVVEVENDNGLAVVTAIASGADYVVYSQRDIPSNGCTLYVGGLGDVIVLTAGGDTVEFENVPAGTFMPVQAVRVYATGHTTAAATNLVAL